MSHNTCSPVTLFAFALCAFVSAGLAQTGTVQVGRDDPTDGFQILVWQYRTDAMADAGLYDSVDLRGFHIDRGDGQDRRAKWALESGRPYYVDHAAGKGILHLTERSGLGSIDRNGKRSDRPWSFFDPATLSEATARLQRNVPDVVNGPIVAIALDDEVSLGTFNSPLEVDFSKRALAAFREWLPGQYANRSELQESWQFDNNVLIEPATYEDVRRQTSERPPSEWRLARWIDFRTFMDRSQSEFFATLVESTNELAPDVPAGVVGGQQPSAYGGFDYSRLRHSLQFIEAYDIGGTNEILGSFWSETPRKPRMQTYFASGNVAADKWFLWYYLAHGCKGVIAWPDMRGKAWFDGGAVHPHIGRLAETFRDVQSPALSVLADAKTQPLFSPIAVLYSHPSVQVGWAIDASVHGKTWPRRSSSLDNSCLSSGKSRVAWTRLLEDLGHQARFIDGSELVSGVLAQAGMRVLVLPQAFALSRAECEAIEQFAAEGGLVIADYGTAVVDQHGTGYETSPLDAFFGIDRSRDAGWFAGHRWEVNGELYRRPFAERLPKPMLADDGGFVAVERAVEETVVQTPRGDGASVFLNASPTGYFDATLRAGKFGRVWRSTIGRLLARHDCEPPVTYRRLDEAGYGVELLRYRAADDAEIWAFVANPTRQASVDGPGSGLSLPESPVTIQLQDVPSGVTLTDLRTNKSVSGEFVMPLDEAVVIRVGRKR